MQGSSYPLFYYHRGNSPYISGLLLLRAARLRELASGDSYARYHAVYDSMIYDGYV